MIRPTKIPQQPTCQMSLSDPRVCGGIIAVVGFRVARFRATGSRVDRV